jgi:hypothetical protein
LEQRPTARRSFLHTSSQYQTDAESTQVANNKKEVLKRSSILASSIKLTVHHNNTLVKQ